MTLQSHNFEVSYIVQKNNGVFLLMWVAEYMAAPMRMVSVDAGQKWRLPRIHGTPARSHTRHPGTESHTAPRHGVTRGTPARSHHTAPRHGVTHGKLAGNWHLKHTGQPQCHNSDANHRVCLIGAASGPQLCKNVWHTCTPRWPN